MTPDREQVLSEFIDAWNAGQRPDVEEYIERVPDGQRSDLADELMAFLALAPSPAYSEADIDAMRSDPVVVAAREAATERGGVLGPLLVRMRERASMTTADVARRLLEALGLPASGEAKAAGYLDRLERGDLEPTRVSQRVFDGLGRVFGLPGRDLENAADAGFFGAARATSAAAVAYRADEDAADRIAQHLDVLADAVDTPGGAARDQIDDLFLGGR